VPAGALYLVSPLASAIGTTYVKKHGAGTSSLLLNRNAMWVASGILWTLALVLEHDVPFAWSGRAVFSIVYLALLGSVTAFGLYFWLLRHVPANRMSVIAYVTPAIALGSGFALGGERVGPWTIAGLAAILVGVFLVHRAGPPKAAVARAPARS
jgi:drug/metabolite transporter (DMT)-like permease